MNDENREETTDRRQWFAACARYTLLGGLAVMSGHLFVKSQRPECQQAVACQQCGAWDSCRLPRAIEARTKKGDSHLLCEAPEGPSRQKVTVTFFPPRKTQG